MAIDTKPSPLGSKDGPLKQAAPSKRPLAPRVQLPPSLAAPPPPQAQELRGRAPAAGPAPPAAPPAPPAPALPVPAPVPEAEARRAKSPSPPRPPVALATEDQSAILARFNLETEDPREREDKRTYSPGRTYEENLARKGKMGRQPMGDDGESLADYDRLTRRPQPGGRFRRSSSREALRLVADYASPEEGGTWDGAAAGQSGEELTVHTERPVDFISKASSFSNVTIEWVQAPVQTQLLYPYGVDGPLINYLDGAQPFAERHGDGLMAFKEGKLWLDKLQEVEYEEKQNQEAKWHEPCRFNRQIFTWRQREHRLLSSTGYTPEGGFFGEAVLGFERVDHYHKCRETTHNLIVVPEISQCWLIAHLAERYLPNPGAVFSKKKRGRGWHCAISNFEPVRKMYILPERPEDQPPEEPRTHCMVVSVQKVHDGNNMIHFEEAFESMKQVSAYENGAGGGWIYCGIAGEETDQSFAPDKEEGCKFQFLSSRPPFV